MGEMKVRNCAEIMHREVCMGCLGLASVTRALRSWPWAPPLGTCCARGLGFEAMPWLCLGDLRAALVALGSILGDSLRLCPRASRPCLGLASVTRALRSWPWLLASRPCLGFALVTCVLRSWPQAPPLGMRPCLGFALATHALRSWPWATPSGTRYARGLGQQLWPRLCLYLNKNTNMINM